MSGDEVELWRGLARKFLELDDDAVQRAGGLIALMREGVAELSALVAQGVPAERRMLAMVLRRVSEPPSS